MSGEGRGRERSREGEGEKGKGVAEGEENCVRKISCKFYFNFAIRTPC